MFRRSLSLAAVLMLGSCSDSTPGSGEFEAKVNTELVPTQATIPDAEGNPQLVAVSRDDLGVQSEFMEGVMLVRPKTDADLQAFLNRYGGTVIGDDTIPEPPPELGITLNAEQRKPTEFVVRLNLAQVDTSSLAANAVAAGLTGVIEFSSEAGMNTFAGIADGVAAGFDASPDYVSYPTQAFPLTLLATQERPNGAGGSTDALTVTRSGGMFPVFGTMGSRSDVTRAWQFLSAHGIQRRVQVAIIDDGFWLNTNGTPLGTDSDFPANPTQYDFLGRDFFADGPNSIGCGATNPCFWHGTGSAGVATGIINNNLGDAGTGGLIADPILLKVSGPRSQENWAIRTAIAWGADVVSMSWGIDCDKGCRIYDRKHTPFDEAVNAGSRTVFVASAGNGDAAGNGYDVGDPHYFHPCIEGHVICVGALNDDATTKQTYSNFGASVAVFAPTNIPVMAQPAATDSNPAGPAAARSFGGTSGSAPFVAGVVGMMKAINPDLSGDDVNRILIETAQSPGGDAFVTRTIDAYAAVRRAAEGFDPVADRLEPNNGSGAPTNLVTPPPHNVLNLSLNSQDHDYFTFESPGASQMVVNLQYPGGLGNISAISLLSLSDTCGTPTRVNDAVGTNGRLLSYDVPGGPLELSLRADDVNAYNLTISFSAPALAPDIYEVNNSVEMAKHIHSFGPEFGGAVVIDPSVTIEANIHDASDVDYYIVRGASLSNPETALLFGSPFVSVYANTSPINMSVYLLNADDTQGDLVAERVGLSCATGSAVTLQPGVYYLIRVNGSVGQYTLFNGAIADPAQLPPILVGGFPGEIIKPGPVEIERELLFPEFFLFIADPAFDTVMSVNPGVHVSLFALSGELLAEGTASGVGERLSLVDLLATQGYALKATPTDLSAGPPTLRLAWEPTSAARVSENLILNPGAEIAVGPDPDQVIPYWDVVGSTPTTLAYADQPGFPSPTGPGPADRGGVFIAGGTNENMSAIRQTVVVDPAWQEAIDAGRVKFRFAAFLGGSLEQRDAASATLIFRRAGEGDSTLGGVSLPAITPLERGGQTGLFPTEVNDQLPVGTAVILVEVSFQGGEGNFNDGYADNLELVLSEYAQ